VYVADTGGVLRALCPGRGEIWAYKLAAPISAPPLFHDGALYVTTESGDVYCFQE
jgi:outer membrane protein assembly factor BamB